MTDNKKDLVKKLVELTIRDPVAAISGNPSELDKKMNEKLRSRIREEQINVRIKHFTLDQINALLDFYATEMGQSIIESEKRISKEFLAGIELVSGEVTEEYQEKRHQELSNMAQSLANKTSEDGT